MENGEGIPAGFGPVGMVENDMQRLNWLLSKFKILRDEGVEHKKEFIHPRASHCEGCQCLQVTRTTQYIDVTWGEEITRFNFNAGGMFTGTEQIPIVKETDDYYY